MTSAKRTRGNGSCLKSTGGGCAILFIGIGIWWMTAQSTPVVHIPAPVLPSPNGFDTLCSAGKQLLDYRKIGFAVNLTHLPGDKDDREYTLTEKERLVHENFASLKLLRESLQEDYWNPPIRSVSTVLPYYMQFRSLALLLELDSMVKAAHHDYGGAIQTNLDAIEMGATIENGSLMMGGLAGDLCQTGGCRMAWSYIDRLDSAHAQAACHRLEAIQKHRVPTWKIVQEEKWLGQAELLEVFQNPTNVVPVAMHSSEADQSINSRLHPIIARLFYLRHSKRRTMDEYSTYLDRQIAIAKQPYDVRTLEPNLPENPIVQMFCPVLGPAHYKLTLTETLTDQLELALALRAYRLDHGKYPVALNELSPAYLSALPSDPFAKGRTFVYRRTSGTYLLYSVGPDGKDDGGSPIDLGPKAVIGRYSVQRDSIGDIVSGVNRR